MLLFAPWLNQCLMLCYVFWLWAHCVQFFIRLSLECVEAQWQGSCVPLVVGTQSWSVWSLSGLMGGTVAYIRHQIASANLVNNAKIMNKHRSVQCSTVKETCLFPFPPYFSSPPASIFFQSTPCISFWLSLLPPQKTLSFFLTSLPPKIKHYSPIRCHFLSTLFFSSLAAAVTDIVVL